MTTLEQRPTLHRMSSFGCEGGTEVDDKDTILERIDTALGCTHPPSVEYIYVEPCRPKDSSTLGKKLLSYTYNWGHGALRYTLPTGEQFLVNILNPVSNKPLVCWTDPTEYFFSTSKEAYAKSEQYGIYMRSYVNVRVEDVPAEDMIRMHDYFQQVQERFKKGEIEYAKSPFHSMFQGLGYRAGFASKEPGSCAEWISRGLVVGGVLNRTRLCPKQITVDLLMQHQQLHSSGGMHVVSLRRAKHGILHPTYDGWDVDGDHPAHHTLTGQTQWLGWLSSERHRNLDKFADVVVEVPTDDSRVSITRKTPEDFTPPGLYGLLIKTEVESWIIPFLFAAVFWLSPLLFFGVVGVMMALLRTTGHFWIFDMVGMLVTFLPFLLGSLVLGVFTGIEGLILDDIAFLSVAAILWRQVLYKFI